MHGSRFPSMECPVARSMAQVGDAWRVLILRDALQGLRRFDDLQQSLGVAPNILSNRLRRLVRDGLLDKRRYQLHPARYEYVPTAKGRDFVPVLAALVAWGTRWLSPDGATVELVDRRSGHVVDPMIVDRRTGRSLDQRGMLVRPGPAAGPEIHQRSARIRARATARKESP